MRRNQLPEGVQDFLPAECRAKRDLEETLRQEFMKNGYEEIETPSFEYYDVFSDGIGAYMQENMIKFFDLNGRILVLRPDVTVPIARMISNNFAEEGQFRFFYIQNAYGVEDLPRQAWSWWAREAAGRMRNPLPWRCARFWARGLPASRSISAR